MGLPIQYIGLRQLNNTIYCRQYNILSHKYIIPNHWSGLPIFDRRAKAFAVSSQIAIWQWTVTCLKLNDLTSSSEFGWYCIKS